VKRNCRRKRKRKEEKEKIDNCTRREKKKKKATTQSAQERTRMRIPYKERGRKREAHAVTDVWRPSEKDPLMSPTSEEREAGLADGKGENLHCRFQQREERQIGIKVREQKEKNNIIKENRDNFAQTGEKDRSAARGKESQIRLVLGGGGREGNYIKVQRPLRGNILFRKGGGELDDGGGKEKEGGEKRRVANLSKTPLPETSQREAGYGNLP